MAKFKSRHSVFILMALVLTVLFAQIISHNRTITAATPVACSPSYVISSSNNTYSLTGNVSLVLTTTTTPAVPVQSVVFSSTTSGVDKVLGRALQSGPSTYYWTMPWVTAVSPNGPHFITATVLDANNNACTVTNPTAFAVSNPTPAQMNVLGITPTSVVVPTNNNIDFTVQMPIIAAGVDISQYVVYEWQTTIGTVIPQTVNNVGRFSSGPASGSGLVSVLVKYGAQIISKTVPVQVVSPNTTPSSTTPPTTSTTTQSTPTAPTSGSTTHTSTTTAASGATLTTQLLKTDSLVGQCLLTSIGEARLKVLEAEQTRPNAEEFEKYRNCFAKSSFVVASSLAPVAPAEVKKLNTSGEITIAKAETTLAKSNGNEVKKLVFKGKGKPNTTVLIYVFSEPLVLATTTDSDGSWSYTLEDPLEPGSHEAYAIVSGGNGTYERSSSFGFLINKASASAANPKGYSLELGVAPTAKQNNRSINFFVAGIVAAALIAGGTLGVLLRVKAKKRQQNALQVNTEQSPQPVVTSPPSSEEALKQDQKDSPTDSSLEP